MQSDNGPISFYITMKKKKHLKHIKWKTDKYLVSVANDIIVCKK